MNQMPLSSRERVLKTFDFQEPDRVPCWCGASDEFWAKAKKELALDDEGLRQRFGDDFRRVFSVFQGPTRAFRHPEANSRTYFGIERSGIGYGQPLEHPLAGAGIDQIKAYAWPDPDWMDISQIPAAAGQYQGQYAILGGEWSPFWHDAIDLVGMEDLYLLMYDDPEAVDLLFSKIVDFYWEVSRRTFELSHGAIDIFFIGNDFGSQTGPLLSKEMFDRFMVPQLKRLVDLGHQYGLKVQMHSCGGIAPLIPSLIELGLDAVHAIQTTCRDMDLVELKRQYGRQIVFNGGIDSHHILIDGTPELVRQKTREVLAIMAPGGAYIGGASHDTVLEETPVANMLAMFDTIREFRF